EDDLKRYGLDRPRYTAVVKAGATEYQLAFGEGEAEGDENRFFRPTFVRLSVGAEARPEVIQLGPGLTALLSRPREFYQKRRLFDATREARSSSGRERVERLNADSVTAEQTGGSRYTLTRQKGEWRLTEPTVDRVDESRRNQ